MIRCPFFLEIECERFTATLRRQKVKDRGFPDQGVPRLGGSSPDQRVSRLGEYPDGGT